MFVIYASTCAALIRLRHLRPEADALRIPFGRALAVIGILISLALLTRLEARQVLLIGITALVAIVNWWWAHRRAPRAEPAVA